VICENTKSRLAIPLSALILTFCPQSLLVSSTLPVKSTENACVGDCGLERRSPEMRMQGVSLEDALEFFEDISGASIVVYWQDLERLGITRQTPVILSFRDLRFMDALAAVFESLITSKVEIDRDDGQITIWVRRSAK
jgi:hypothetical protein